MLLAEPAIQLTSRNAARGSQHHRALMHSPLFGPKSRFFVRLVLFFGATRHLLYDHFNAIRSAKSDPFGYT
eukprot:COSAG02_NODE_5767_length_4055_cov_2.085693_3_plen_71_part_00